LLGDHVHVKIEAIDAKQHRIALSMQGIRDQRWHRKVPTPSNTSKHAEQPHEAPSFRDAPPSLPLQLPDRRPPRRILVVEDDALQNEQYSNWLQEAGQIVCQAGSVEEALSELGSFQADLVLTDLGLPDGDGIQLIQKIRQRYPHITCGLMTNWAAAEIQKAEIEHLSQQGVCLLFKPLHPDDLLEFLIFERPVMSSTGLHSSSVLAKSHEQSSQPLEFMPTSKQALARILKQLHKATGAKKVVLFALDRQQRAISVLEEYGRVKLNGTARIDLVHSPVRDVAEDGYVIRVEDVRNVEPQVRKLRPLLSFRSCLGMPVPVDNEQQGYALFLFYKRPESFDSSVEKLANFAALALGALLENQQWFERTRDLQRMSLIGHLTSNLVHEINHQLSPTGFALSSLRDLCEQLYREIRHQNSHPEPLVIEARTILDGLSKSVRRLMDTARGFGKLTIKDETELLRIDVLVADIIGLVKDVASRHRVRIHFHSPERILLVEVRSSHLQQVLLNVLLNAIQQIALLRPQEGGQVQIRVSPRQQNGRTLLAIEIEDDGPGIHHRLWQDIFRQGFTTREGEGSGLGLSIARRLLEDMHGNIRVAESAILWGSTFVVELPLATFGQARKE